MKNLLTTSFRLAQCVTFLTFNLLGGVFFAQGNNPTSNNGQGATQWKINGNIADSSHYIGTKNEFPVKFRTIDIERMRITPEGNVGIGTSDAPEKLTVDGNILIREGDLFLNNLVDPSLTADEILLLDITGRVKKGGDLKSLVYAPLPALLPCLVDANGNSIDDSPHWQHSPGKLFTSNHCVPDVKVGIGIIPESKLHIQLNENSFNTHAIIVQKSNNEKILQLTENGLLLAREIKVDLTVWSDYVFDPTYPLMPLEEVKSFIEENHHLPNVPNAAEMVENGLNVAEASIMLMEKVEELTLYMIQLQEQIKKQDEILKLQQAKIETLESKIK